MPQDLQIALVALQAFQVLFLALHDWVPLGRLNDIAAARRENSGGRLLRVTLVSVVPYAIGLAGSIAAHGRHYPGWLVWWLWISYAILFAGELRAWWVPYFFTNEPARAARYDAMFGKTLAFLPRRHGIAPNALHVALQAATLATLVLLGVMSLSGMF